MKKVHALEFDCEHCLRFLEHCNSCPKKGRCKERGLLKAIINETKKLDYEKKE